MSEMSKIERVESLLRDIKDNVSDSSEDLKTVFYNREAYLSAFEETCDRFDIDVDVELEEDESKDDVYSEWKEHVNMSASELQKWSRNPCSREASVDPEAVIKRNMRLLEKNKEDWTSNDVEDAKRTISFISRMKANRPDSPREGPHGCPSEWAISMLNWAFNPFSSVPTPSSESKEDLEPVEEVSLQERKNIKEAEMLAEHVWILKDVLMEAGRDFEDQAMKLEESKSREEVEQVREELEERLDVLMEKVEGEAAEIRGGEAEMRDYDDEGAAGYEFEPVPDQVLYLERSDAMTRSKDLGLDGVHEHVMIVDGEETQHFMPGETHQDWVERVKSLPDTDSEEMSQNRKATQVIHGNEQERNKLDDDEDDGVRVPPVAIHKVDGGSSVQVEDDVEDVLDELWQENQED